MYKKLTVLKKKKFYILKIFQEEITGFLRNLFIDYPYEQKIYT